MTDRLIFFAAAGAVWLGLYRAFGQPILLVIGGLILLSVSYQVGAEWWRGRAS